jgi:hypothetical protein
MTGYVEAFKRLGFSLANPRNSVSAERPDGIALAVFRAELAPDMTTFDRRVLSDLSQPHYGFSIISVRERRFHFAAESREQRQDRASPRTRE